MPDEHTHAYQPERLEETQPVPAPVANPTTTAAHSPPETLAHSPAEVAHAASASAMTGGVSVPGYEISGELGRGGMGVVYRAWQAGLNRTVALKMLIAGAYSDPATRTRFLLEAESVAALEHPNIVKVFAFGEHDSHPFLAMEFLPGGSLADRVRASGPLPPLESASLVAKLATAVAHAHTRGVVHRDIKPANVLLTSDGEPRLTDFGLAKVGRSDLSVTGQVLGTPAYMAPEQAAGKVREVGTPADVYALGAVLYDLLTGRPPFLGHSAAATLQKVLTAEPVHPRSLKPSIPRDLETICLKCLEKEPDKRYATAQAVADDLNRFLEHRPITARLASDFDSWVKWSYRNTLAAITIYLLGLLVGVVGLAIGLAPRAFRTFLEQVFTETPDLSYTLLLAGLFSLATFWCVQIVTAARDGVTWFQLVVRLVWGLPITMAGLAALALGTRITIGSFDELHMTRVEFLFKMLPISTLVSVGTTGYLVRSRQHHSAVRAFLIWVAVISATPLVFVLAVVVFLLL